MDDLKLGSSPLGLVTYTLDNTKVKMGVYERGGSYSFFNSLFRRSPKDDQYEFDYTVEDQDTHELSTTSIIRFTEAYPAMRLQYSDFAYLRDLGVYPNNRLVIARRFRSPVADDLTSLTGSEGPMSTLISWVTDNSEFFDLSFNETWTQADVSFESILNDASKNRDVLGGDNAGKPLGTFLASKAGQSIPLRGWSEGLQYSIFKSLGLTDRDAADLPTGNPNLIRQAQQRSIAGKDDAFSGLNSTISVKMTVVYEQKFISGVDPSLVYYDILANALSFGTSDSKFMFRSDSLNPNIFSDFLGELGSGNRDLAWKAVNKFAKALYEGLGKILGKINEFFKSFLGEGGKLPSLSDFGDRVGDLFVDLLVSIAANFVSKYKVRLVGALSSLTGAPSGPWHVTIGNPRRPVFSSGDMICQSVEVKLGKLLAYNDLPSTVTISLTLGAARPYGKQEIFKKLNCGKVRTYYSLPGKLDIFSSDTLKGPDSAEVRKLVPDLNTGNNSGGSNATPKVVNPGPAPGSTASNAALDQSCQKMFDEMVKDMAAEVNAGWNGIFKDGKDDVNDDEKKMSEIFKREFTTGKYADKYTVATRCAHVKTLLDSKISEVAAGILSGSGSTSIKLYDGNSQVVGFDP